MMGQDFPKSGNSLRRNKKMIQEKMKRVMKMRINPKMVVMIRGVWEKGVSVYENLGGGGEGART